MNKFQESASLELLEKQLISPKQFVQVKAYRDLGIFSLHNELRALLYLSVTLFTAGIGILIYQNIDTIGHQILLLLLLIVIIVCYYFCFKNAPNFKKTHTHFVNPLYDYLLLLATILTCTFIGYLQFQYNTFGTHYGLATLIPTLISFATAYFFDHKGILTIAITGLAASIGISANPQMLLHWETFSLNTLGVTAIALGLVLIVWKIYSLKINLKNHFELIYCTYALHLISIASISNSFDRLWFVYILILAISTYYFFLESHKQKSISLYIFTILYGYIGLNSLLFHFFDTIDLPDFVEIFVILIPVYFIFSVIGFIKLIKDFKK